VHLAAIALLSEELERNSMRVRLQRETTPRTNEFFLHSLREIHHGQEKRSDLLVDVLAETGVANYGVSGDSLNGVTDSIRASNEFSGFT